VCGLLVCVGLYRLCTGRRQSVPAFRVFDAARRCVKLLFLFLKSAASFSCPTEQRYPRSLDAARLIRCEIYHMAHRLEIDCLTVVSLVGHTSYLLVKHCINLHQSYL